MKHDLDHTHLM